MAIRLKQPPKPGEVDGRILTNKQRDSIARQRKTRRKAGYTIEVGKHDRTVVKNLPSQALKEELFDKITMLARRLEKDGVTATDKTMARKAIILLADTCFPDGDKVLSKL